MSDIFLSYASEDRERAHEFVKIFERQGWTVFWDRIIPPGGTFDQVIEDELAAAKCTVVLWTKYSIHKNWVKIEASEGLKRGILVPALLDDVPIPLEFRRTQAATFIGWSSGTIPVQPWDHMRLAIMTVIRAGPTAPERVYRTAAEHRRPFSLSRAYHAFAIGLVAGLVLLWVFRADGILPMGKVASGVSAVKPPSRGDLTPVPPADTRPRVVWAQKVGIQTWRNNPILVGNYVFVGSSGATWDRPDQADGLYCLDAASGARLWFVHTKSDFNDAIYHEGLVVGGTDGGEVIAVSSVGDIIWRTTVEGSVYARPVLAGDDVAIATGRGNVYLLSLKDGAKKFTGRVDGPVRAGMASNGRHLWITTTAGSIYRLSATDLTVERKAAVYYPDRFGSPQQSIGDFPKGLERFADDDGTKKYSRASLYGAPLILTDKIIVGFVRETYYSYPAVLAFDADLGNVLWVGSSFGKGADLGNIRFLPAYYAGKLIFGDPYSNRIYALSENTGLRAWTNELGQKMFQHWSSPVVRGDYVFVARHDGLLHKLRAADGSRIWSIYLGRHDGAGISFLKDEALPAVHDDTLWNPDTSSPIFATPAVSSDTIVVGTNEGYLYAIR
jgi:outer membrane protein assembly factor BamB